MSPILRIGENMELQYEEYGFYRINKEYLQYLHNIDNQVFFKDESDYDRKPHLGLLVGIDNYTYCIPLTSAKKRHLSWQNVSEHNYVIYEIIDKEELHSNDIYKQYSKEPLKFKKILSVLEIRKMIPVNKSIVTKIIFDDIEDENYRNLLLKEYRFLGSYKKAILDKALDLYSKQKETGVVKSCYVTFDKIEEAYNNYLKILIDKQKL